MSGLADLERWAADARAREAADSRARQRWLRSQAGEDASLAGTLLALAERRETVVLTTVAGRRHRGVVTGVGLDFVVMEGPSGSATLVSLAGLAEVRVADDGSARRKSGTTGHEVERGALGVRLLDVLAQAAGGRPRVFVQAGATPVIGDLEGVGRDVLTVRADGAAGPVYVALVSVSEVSFLASG